MHSRPILALLVALCVTLPSAGDLAVARSLQGAAADAARRLPRGAIVTAESTGDAVRFATAGTLEPSGNRPESAIFEIGSITKVFTGLLLAVAVQEGKVSLETRVADILGPTRHFADPKVGNITLRQLATHTSGLPRLPADLLASADPSDPYAHYDRDKLLGYLATARIDGPTAAPLYSNLGAGLLGDLLALAYGQPWDALIRSKITGPLGMRDTLAIIDVERESRLAPPYEGDRSVKPWTSNALAGAGVLRSTAADLVRFGKALLHPERTPLSSAITFLLAPQPNAPRMGLLIARNTFNGELVYEHNGGTGGYRAFLQVAPSSDTVRVILIDNAAGTPEAILAATAGTDHPAYVERPLSTPSLKEYEGVYGSDPAMRFTVLVHDGRLMVRLTRQSFLPVFGQERDDRFFYKAVDAELLFERTDGQVTALVLFQGGRDFRVPKTDLPVPRITFLPREVLQEYVGTYSLAPGKSVVVKEADSTLFGQLTGQPFISMFPTSRDEFEVDGAPAIVRFQRGADGKVSGLDLVVEGRTEHGVRD